MHRDAIHVAVLDDYQGVAAQLGDWAMLPARVELDAIDVHLADRTELAARLAGAEVVVAMRERTTIDDALLGLLPDLRLIVTTGPSNAVIDVAAANDRGITVCGTGGSLAPTSELTWALILALARHVPAEDRNIRGGGWQHTVGTDLAGRMLGLVGLGRIGKLVARAGVAFGMEVQAWSRNLDPEAARRRGVTPVERDVLFATSDVISIHMVLSERSRGLVGARELDLMKPTALLVNTSRGPIIDEIALVDALTRGTIGGAGLDVFDREPLPPEHPLRALPNTVLTPHIGYVTDGLYELFYREIVEDIGAWLAGEPIRVVEAA